MKTVTITLPSHYSSRLWQVKDTLSAEPEGAAAIAQVEFMTDGTIDLKVGVLRKEAPALIRSITTEYLVALPETWETEEPEL